MKIKNSFLVSLLILLSSCGNKEEILLPKSNRTIVSKLVDHSPVYIFFRTNAKDTLAEVNRNNTITSTHWIFNVDKRLPLGLVIPKVMKLQEKKRAAVLHKNEASQNYYSYADSIAQNMAFLPFTEVFYKMEKPKQKEVLFFDKDNIIWLNGIEIKKEDLAKQLKEHYKEDTTFLSLGFSKNLSYGNYIQNKIFIQSLSSSRVLEQEYIY